MRIVGEWYLRGDGVAYQRCGNTRERGGTQIEWFSRLNERIIRLIR
jgi:hypothetical protein